MPSLSLGSGLFLAGASTLVGSLAGFLFGVPVREREPGTDDTGSANRSIGYRPNTNLEQISDWLTKIIVGIGLVQFPKISHFLLYWVIMPGQPLAQLQQER